MQVKHRKGLAVLFDLLTLVQVHAYLATPGGKTAYLSELKSGAEVLVVDPQGRQRTAIVGRIKVEQRPLVCCHSGRTVLHEYACQSMAPQQSLYVGRWQAQPSQSGCRLSFTC